MSNIENQYQNHEGSSCFHCGLEIENGINISIENKPFCCTGCKAVFALISAGGLDDYYNLRSEFPEKPGAEESDPREFDNLQFQQSFCQALNNTTQAQLYIDGIHCAACVWLLEKSLQTTLGVQSVDISLVDNSAQIIWNTKDLKLSKIVKRIEELGYHASPWNQDSNKHLQEKTEKQLLRRSALAGIMMMQVGMFSIALYASGKNGMAAEYKSLFHIFSALLTTPVLLYSAKGFFSSAWRSLKQTQINMDVPICTALGIAWLASLLAIISGKGEVYFDSVCMFVFFLTGVRYLELRARNKFTNVNNQGAVPTTVRLLRSIDTLEFEHIDLHDAHKGQIIFIKQGEMVPIDGNLMSSIALLNEASISGEFLPVNRSQGDPILSGSINQSPQLLLEVERPANESCLQSLQRLAIQARDQQPSFLKISDKVARYFSISILFITLLTAGIWYLIDSDRVLEITISMLVISCPCALSLAAPSAFAVAINSLRKKGVLVCESLALEKLNSVNTVAFDKTGTLTKGKFTIKSAHYFSTSKSPDELDNLAANMELWSEHPIAEAFSQLKVKPGVLAEIEVVNSSGIKAQVNGQQIRIGSREFCRDFQQKTPPTFSTSEVCTEVWLADSDEWLACYELADTLREGSADTITSIQKERQIDCQILSGDNSTLVAHIANKLGVSTWTAECSPSNKRDLIKNLQDLKKKSVMMVGDGINDLPVLAQADVSVAMNSANHLAQVQADCILLNNDISSLGSLFRKAQNTFRIVKQNITWALLYNFTALPLAAFGLVPPWLAALGMSLSSLLVVLNAGRLNRS